MLDFGALPPEINSGRMYAGPGSGSMLAAATAWDGLAADLHSAAASYRSVISGLTGGSWQGPASASMATAAAPYVGWISATATQAEHAANQARAAAGGYEAAFAMTVPPPVIVANRTQLAALVATNFLGQNTPAIMATEAHYAAMWAQDAAAMYGYAATEAAVTKTITPFSPPAQTTNPAAAVGQAGAVAQATGTSAGQGTQTTLSQAMSAVPATLQGLAAPATTSSSSSGLAGLTNAVSGTGTTGSLLDPNSNFLNTISSSGAFNPGQALDAVLPGLIVPPQAVGASGLTGDFGGLASAAALPAGSLGAGGWGLPGGLSGVGGAGSAVSAGVGQAASIGPLSVPPAWAPAAPAPAPVSPFAAANTSVGAVTQNGAPGAPGVPLAGLGAHPMPNAAPRYGFRPNVISRPPAAG